MSTRKPIGGPNEKPVDFIDGEPRDTSGGPFDRCLDCGGDCLILSRSDARVNPDDHDVHHAFIVEAEDYEAAKQDLTANGVDVFFEEDRQGGAVNGPRAYFHDPDGNVLEIIHLTSDKGDPAK